MGIKRSLFRLTICSGFVLGGTVFPALLAKEVLTWGLLATALGGVAMGNTANAIDDLTQGNNSGRVSLDDGDLKCDRDLMRAVGNAISAVIALEATQQRPKIRWNLERIAAHAKDNWVKMAREGLTQQRYPELQAGKLDQFFTPEERRLTQQGKLTETEWGEIFDYLNSAACKNGSLFLPSDVRENVAERLHTTFLVALQQTLKEDFQQDGTAFAGFILQLLTEMKAQLSQLQTSQVGVTPAKLTQILQQLEQTEAQLGVTVTQQQDFFREISDNIDSGFTQVCQQLGVMETTITKLLQTLEERIELLHQEVTDFRQEMRQEFEVLQNQPRGRQLSKREYRSRQKLLSDMRTEVKERLNQSLHQAAHRAALLNLGKEQQPHQVQRPWDMSVKVGEQQSVQLPAQTTIIDVFDNPAISGKFLILGKPGGGKTTTLLELAEVLIERADEDSNAPIPVILELSNWKELTKQKFPNFWERTKYDPSIQEWVLSQLKGVNRDLGKQWLQEKELVLLLDGLDELKPERQAKCVRAINQFLESEFSPLHLVVCSRQEEYEDYEEILHLNSAIYLEDLTVEQMQDYFNSVDLAAFWTSIKDSIEIVNFIRQPLFLAISSIAYKQLDVEEWRNCNTEERAINYLLGIYRIKMLGKNDIEYIKYCQSCLCRLAKGIGQNNGFRVKELDFNFVDSWIVVRTINHISLSLAFLSFPIIPFLIPLEINIFNGVMLAIMYVHTSIIIIEESRYLELWSLVLTTMFALGIMVEFSYYVHHIIGQEYVLRFSWIISLIYWIMFALQIKVNNFLDTEREIPQKLYQVKKFNSAIIDRMLKYASYRFSPEKKNQTLIIIATSLLSLFLSYGVTNGNWFVQTSLGYLSVLPKKLLEVLLIALFVPSFAMLLFSLGLMVFVYIYFLALLSAFSIDCCHVIRRYILRIYLGLTGQMPWNITDFLDDCTERLILQRVGNRYRFIHRLVQEHFAQLEIQNK
ncbi:NACHT domain-containing protein [Roseofilum casamattae]|uniref:NACHT domain-containing protein n=1 Tax=Roseofilum casamattae BLCC-M143 TaxID=3022442 RepID=A0ABT7BX91_9CYAN|nr:NACHT domain-containing protein [Roseofilum casamattae BLCC-M143]